VWEIFDSLAENSFEKLKDWNEISQIQLKEVKEGGRKKSENSYLNGYSWFNLFNKDPAQVGFWRRENLSNHFLKVLGDILRMKFLDFDVL
jgi:hypothetical protein